MAMRVTAETVRAAAQHGGLGPQHVDGLVAVLLHLADAGVALPPARLEEIADDLQNDSR